MTGYLVVVRLAGGAVAPRFGIHVTVGLKAWVLPVVLAPISDFPGVLEPRELRPRIIGDWSIHHARVLRPATCFYPDGWWGYLIGSGEKIFLATDFGPDLAPELKLFTFSVAWVLPAGSLFA